MILMYPGEPNKIRLTGTEMLRLTSTAVYIYYYGYALNYVELPNWAANVS